MLLKHKLYVSLIAATLLPLSISTLLFSNSLRGHAEHKFSETTLPTALSNVRNAIEHQLSIPISTSRAIAKNLFVERFIEKGESPNDIPSFIAYLNHVKNNDLAASAFIVSDKTKKYYSFSGEIRTLSFPNDNWFKEFIYKDKPYELIFDINHKTNKAKIYVNYAIEIKGIKVGIGGISHSVNSINDKIKNYSIGESGIVYLVDNNGKIKLHPDKELIGSVITLNNIAYGHQHIISRGEDEFITSSIPLTSLDWHLVAEVPIQELYGPIDRAIQHNLIYGGLIALLGIIFIILFANKMFKPIEEITASVSSLATKIIGKR